MVAEPGPTTKVKTVKRLLTLAFSLLLLIPGAALAQLFQARFVTSAYSWQRLDAASQTESHLYGFQGAQFMLGSKDFTFRTYMQGFNDFAGPNKNDPSFKLYSLSVSVRNLLDMVDVQAGRLYVFSGAGRGLIDGLSATVRPLKEKLTVKGFYGLLTPGDRSLDLSDSENFLAGVHVSSQLLPSLQVSASVASKGYSQEGYTAVRADTLFNPFTFDFRPMTRTEDIVSADARYDVEGYGDVYVRYDHDITAKEMAKLNAFGRFRIMPDLAITAEYLRREPRISFQSIFSVFTYSTVQDINAGIEYGLMDGWHLLANVGSISYGDESSQRVTLGVNGEYVSASFATNISDRSTLDAASLNAGYPLFDNFITPTILVSYAHYKLDADAPTNDALGVSGGLAIRPLQMLLVDAQVQWMNNKVYTSDTRFFLRISYALSHRFSMF